MTKPGGKLIARCLLTKERRFGRTCKNMPKSSQRCVGKVYLSAYHISRANRLQLFPSLFSSFFFFFLFCTARGMRQGAKEERGI